MTNHSPLNIKEIMAGLAKSLPMKKVAWHDFQFHFLKLNGVFEWHSHKTTDKILLVVEGEMFIEFTDKPTVVVKAGEFYVIEKECYHRPGTHGECEIVLIDIKR